MTVISVGMNDLPMRASSKITGDPIKKLDQFFYIQQDVITLARSLLGKVLCTDIDGKFCSGIITETEAYAGINDKGSHAYGYRKTNRTRVMYEQGGIAYIYLCYGIHSMFNVVCGPENSADAVLVRALFPLEGMSVIQSRSGQKIVNPQKCMNGPGKVCKAMGLHYSMTGISLQSEIVFIEDHGFIPDERKIITGKRIGITYAEEDALLPYRFLFTYDPE